MTTKLLGYKDLCPMLGRNYKTIWGWVRDGKFPAPIKLHNRTLGWRVETVEEWLEEQESTQK
ncbi:helix-turn-helix transcriptional regulator [Vibrio breoganii]